MSSPSYQLLPVSDSAGLTSRRVFSKGPRYYYRLPSPRHLATVVVTFVLTYSLFSFYHTPKYPNQPDFDFPTTPDEYTQPLPANLGNHDHIPHPPNISNLSTLADSAQDSSPLPPTDLIPPSPVTFSLIMYSENSAAEGAILIKSIIMYSSSPLEFHIICDQDAQQYLEHRLRLVTHPQHNISVQFYRIPYESMVARIHREGALHTDHDAGVPGLMKLFIHEILPPSVERAIFIDTDAFFISDPTQLWDRFDAFKPSTAVSMPYHREQYAPEWHHASKICSCIMLLDLKRLRELRLMDSEFYRERSLDEVNQEGTQSIYGPPAFGPPAFEAMYGAPVQDGDSGRMKYENVKLGDQGYWWAIVSYRQDIFEPLSFDWEVSSCLVDMYGIGLGDDDAEAEAEVRHQIHVHETLEQGRAILPKMLHFNCLDAGRYYEWPKWTDPNDGLAQRWGPAVRYHAGFKWLWLNVPSSNASLAIEFVHDVKFADELFAQTANHT